MSEKHLRKRLGADGVKAIADAVKEAERKTSAEIAVFVREWTFVSARLGVHHSHHEIRGKAERLFVRHGLDRTRDRNGVMLYVSLAERAVVVLGDRAINEKVTPQHWQQITAGLVKHAKRGEVTQGIVEAVGAAGQLLASHFPLKADDTNELPDEPNLG